MKVTGYFSETQSGERILILPRTIGELKSALARGGKDLSREEWKWVNRNGSKVLSDKT